MGRVPRIPCAHAGSSHQTGCRAHPSARRLGRDRVRRELRRPGRVPRARRIRRARAHARPLRGRRAPDQRVRRADRVAAGPRARELDAPDLQRPRHPHADEDVPLDAAVDVLDLRLPRAVRAAARPGARRRVRHGQGRRPDGVHPAHRPRRPDRAADRRRPRLAAGALQRAAGHPAARRAPLARPGGPPARLRRRPRAVARPRLRARRATRGASRRATSCASASARSSRATASRSRPCAWPATSTSPPCATRATGSPTRCARPSRTASSSSATAPGTACRPPPRASAPRCTSASPAGASCASSSTGRQTREQALARYADFCEEHRWAFSWLLRVQRWVGRLNPYPAMTSALRADGPPVLRRLVLRALPRDRAAGVRLAGPPSASRTPSRQPTTVGVVRSLLALLLRPAVAVLDRLRLAHKLVLIALVLIAPALYATWQFRSQQNAQIAFSTKERVGDRRRSCPPAGCSPTSPTPARWPSARPAATPRRPRRCPPRARPSRARSPRSTRPTAALGRAARDRARCGSACGRRSGATVAAQPDRRSPTLAAYDRLTAATAASSSSRPATRRT